MGGGGGQNCNGCRSWEEDIYWTHFQFLHFAKFLRPGFDQHLALPKTFSDNIKKKLPENVTLKGPGGVVWNIGLTTRDDALYFTQGWQQFVKDHSLKENDFLVFKYNGESLFEVLIFDGESLCEKAASYFVRKCGHANAEQHGGGCSSKRRETVNSVEEVNTPSNGGVDFACPEQLTADAVTKNEQLTANAVTKNEPAAIRSPTPSKRTNKPVHKRRGRPPKASKPHEGEFVWVTESKGKAVDDRELFL